MQADQIIFTDHFQFTKRSPATRSARLNQSDPILSIPVEHNHSLSRISETKITAELHWRKKHFANIYHQFHNEAYAYFYMPQIKELIFSDSLRLSDYVFDLLKQIISWLHFNGQIYLSSHVGFQTDNSKSVITWCKQTRAETYLYSGQVFKQGWLNKDFFQRENIQPQRFESFPDDVHILKSNRNLTILSFLFQYGPEAGCIVRQYFSSEPKRLN